MKFTKLSLVAAIAVSSAFAGGDIAPVEPAPVVETSPWTFGGDAKLYYKTNSSVAGASIFDQAAAQGQAAVSADIGYAINSNWKVNAGLTGLMTLGLDDSVVSGVWLYAGADAIDNPAGSFTSVGDALWIDTLNITGTMFDGKLTTVLGRQALDTPLAFSEQWTIAQNTFDAAVALANPIDNLTLVAAYIYDGNGNGPRITTFDGVTNAGGVYTGEASAGGFTGSSGYFPVLGIDKGAWAVAAIYNFTDAITGQAWYYDVMDVAQAVWVQADAKVSGFTLGAQYAWIGTDSTLENKTVTALGVNPYEDSSAWAAKIGYGIDALNVWAAYSDVDDTAAGKTAISVSNTATMLSGAGWGNSGKHSGQSKLYTEAWWNYGYVGQAGATTVAVGADYTLGEVSIFKDTKISAQYTSIKDAKEFLAPLGAAGLGFDDTVDLDEIAIVLGTDVMGLNAQIAYIATEETTNLAAGGSSTDNTDEIQLYLTYKF
ncbi:MAG: hypothetical protein L3J47_12700 [Sulfurovum sp.]|nr:hypothetical protein [Sulfurovum sp.]